MAEILETFPSDRLQVLAAGQGWFTPYRPKALNGKVFWTAPHLEKISRNYQVGVENRSYYDVTRNANRHVLRRVPADRLATFNIVDEHDGFARLCPFLGMDHGPCSGDLGAFPRATFTEEKKQRHGQVGHGRRLNSCFCRKAFKEIGRDWGRHTNATDDDDDTAVEAPTPAKKEALPAFALDFGNGA